MLGAAFGVGFVLGPALGGVLGTYDPRLPFWISAGLSVANGMYGIFVLPESLPTDKRASFSWAKANPIGALAMLWARPGLLGLAAVAFLHHLAHDVNPATFVLYVTHRYGWTEAMVGLCLAAVGVASMIVQAGLVKPIVQRLRERATLLLGLFFGALGFTFQGWAPTGAWFFAGIPLVTLWGVAMPALQGLATQRADATEQGRLQGALSSLMGVALLIGPGLFTQVFAQSIDPAGSWTLPGAPFLLAELLLLAALVLATQVSGVPRRVEAGVQ
jgi:DHA1 family tetracycline resistance protein-like MFS transporter